MRLDAGNDRRILLLYRVFLVCVTNTTISQNVCIVEAPLTNLTKKDVAFKWKQTEEAAFKRSKESLMDALLLRNSESKLQVEVQRYAAKTGIWCSTAAERRGWNADASVHV
jgi:hypothetical protein